MTASGYRMYSKPSRDSQYELIERYAPLVKRIAYHLLARLPASVQVDDLIQAGMIGLLEVSSKYDATKGASFETYAGIRIRGAMIDEIRRGDWVPRSVHRNTRRISEAIDVVEQLHGRDAKDAEVAEQLGVSRVMLSKILNAKAGISADMALRLSAWLDTSPEVWLEMQSAYDLWQAEQKPLPDVQPLRLAA